jgi:kinesin family member C1
LFRQKTKVELNLRRSKSAIDLRDGASTRTGVKRFQSTLENIPSKRLRPAISKPNVVSKSHNKAISRPAISMKTQEKKDAIINSLKSSSIVTNVKKPLVKSISHGSTLTKNAAPAKPKETVAATSKNIAKLNKIPPYDFKARFLNLKAKYDELKVKSDQQTEQISTLEEQSENFETKEKELQERIAKIEEELFDATEEKAKLEKEIHELKLMNNNLMMKSNALAIDLHSKSEDLVQTSNLLSELKSKHDKQAVEYEVLKNCSKTLKEDYEEASTKLTLSQDQLYLINIERKLLHNMVLDLRGNIRVFARVRPPLPSEEHRMLCGWSFVDETALEIHSNELVPSGGRKQTKHDFAFDQVFDPNTLQEDIFETVSPLIQSALDGYNICIFAYGQTGKFVKKKFNFIKTFFNNFQGAEKHLQWTVMRVNWVLFPEPSSYCLIR